MHKCFYSKITSPVNAFVYKVKVFIADKMNIPENTGWYVQDKTTDPAI